MYLLYDDYSLLLKPKHQFIFCVGWVWTPNFLFDDKKFYKLS